MYSHFVFPKINPIAINVMGFSIFWYGILYCLGLMLAWNYARKIAIRFQIDLEIFDALLTPLILGVIIGARLGFCLFYDWDSIVQNPFKILEIRGGGMSFHGGMVGLILSLIYYSRKTKVSFWKYSDLISTCAPIGLFFGRIGNLINMEHYGRVSDFPWSMIFLQVDALPRHPSQIYEALSEGLFLAFILHILFKKYKNAGDGFLSFSFLILYGLLRSFCELFRIPDGEFLVLGIHFTAGQILSLPMILVGVLGIYIKCILKK
ncbi:MAG: prolipoprotein diacylglyceryl transferase [Candidatus Puniceispirillum sp.]|nr:prolipoprotein diacylglyceryl transferase [Candidatus Pelagibacter sp.]MBA4283578.1 prolipoprotein diacylglyceryl transferase [Candidatus Puniceispirillum sp.]